MKQSKQKLHIDEVIQCLVEREKAHTSYLKPPENISHLYESTKALLGQFQSHINRCKKYNQARIHRKYQILIKDLSDQNDILKSKVAEELHARPSSQKYVSDLIDKMIELRRQNERLMRENQSLNNMLTTYEEKTQFLLNSSRQSHESNPQNAELLKKEFEKNALKNALALFITNKKAQTKNQQSKEKSNFQKFLLFNKGKVQKWTMLDFFQKIDRWTANLKDIRFIDRSKIKSSFQRHFEPQRNESPISVDPVPNLPNTINTLRTTNQTKSYLEGTYMPKSKIIDRIIAKNKKTPSFRLRTLSHQPQEIRVEQEYIQ